jgi:hypothetical protein
VKEIEVREILDYTALPADVEKCANGRLFQESADARAAGRLWETQTSDSASVHCTEQIESLHSDPWMDSHISSSKEEEMDPDDLISDLPSHYFHESQLNLIQD